MSIARLHMTPKEWRAFIARQNSRAAGPSPRGGTQYVNASDITGMPGRCWCGEKYGHEWDGKDEGNPHPS